MISHEIMAFTRSCVAHRAGAAEEFAPHGLADQADRGTGAQLGAAELTPFGESSSCR